MPDSARPRPATRRPSLALPSLLTVALLAIALLAGACRTPREHAAFAAPAIRVATFNASLSRDGATQLVNELAAGSAHASAVAAIVQRVRPDILVLQEFDFDPADVALDLFRSRYLAKPQHGGTPIEYPHRWSAPTNTGESSDFDLDGDGRRGGPGDAFGFGHHPGQYGFAILSRHPIETASIRSFRHLPWSAMPGHAIPPDFFSTEAQAALRLSSKNHVDVPVHLPDGRTLHLLVSHPTPPVFDGDEDRNGRRNHDELRFWSEFLTATDAPWLVDDAGVAGGLPPGAMFVLCGDLNCDPNDGDSFGSPVRALLAHPRIDASFIPRSVGGIEAARIDGGKNALHLSSPDADTADFDDTKGPGNLRSDYVLPGRTLRTVDGGVFWPAPDQPDAELVRVSDHRLVWLDLR